MCIIKAAGQNQRAQSDPTLCRCAIKPKLYCNESLLGKSYVSIAAHALEGTNLLLWLQTSGSLPNTLPDTQHYAGRGHTSAAHCDCTHAQQTLWAGRGSEQTTPTMSGSIYPLKWRSCTNAQPLKQNYIRDGRYRRTSGRTANRTAPPSRRQSLPWPRRRRFVAECTVFQAP